MPALFVLALLTIVAVVVLGQVNKAKRRDALALVAKQLGLQQAPGLPVRPDELGFHLFTLGDGSDFGNVMGGRWHDIDLLEFDYEYYDETTDSEGRTSRSYRRFSVALVRLDISVPFVRIEPETLLTRVADHLAMRDIEFESEQFNRTYNVTSPQREFAFKVIDAPMMEHLLGLGAGALYEIGGSWLLVYAGRLAPAAIPGLAAKAKAFVDHIPRLVWDEFRKAAS